jgi:energy-coupling factor transporter ATP-binding protein EcfA2
VSLSPGRSSFDVFEVFTPGTQARLNYVPRLSVEGRITQALQTPGKQVIVYGESGSGKSTLLLKKLEELYTEHITTRCSSTTTFEELLLDGFDQLDQYYTDTSSNSSGRSRSLTADFLRIQATIGSSTSGSQTASRIVPPQLTAHRLGQFMGELGLCWVIEDFHKPDESEKTQMNQTLKIFSDLASEFRRVKIVAIGATETAREVVEYEPEMANRVDEILVPLLDDDELRMLLENGQRLMNVDFTSLVDSFVQYATGMASVCHQLGLNACLEKDVITPAQRTVRFVETDLRPIAKRYLNDCSDTLKKTFDMALHRERKRKYDNCRLILMAIASGQLVGMHNYEILDQIRKIHHDYPSGNLTNYLNELMSDKRGAMLRHSSDGRFRFIDPLHHVYAQITLIEEPVSDFELDFSPSPLSADYLAQVLRTGVIHPIGESGFLESRWGVNMTDGAQRTGPINGRTVGPTSHE